MATTTLAPTGGLIGTPVTTAPDVTQATAPASGVVPTTQAAQTTANVQAVAPTQTVSGQLDEMLKADSPYIQRAQSRSMEQSNARGLLNSSMAAGAGTSAAIDAAAPIAQGNANLFADARNRNQDALNTTGQFNAASANQFALTDKQQGFDLQKMAEANRFSTEQMQNASVLDLQKMAAAQGYDLAKMAADQGLRLEQMSAQQVYDLAKMDKTYTQADREAQAKFGYDKALMEIQKSSNIEVAGIEAAYRNLIQASSSVSSMSNVVSQNINAVLLNEKLDAAAKTKAVADIKANYQAALQLVGVMSGDLDLSSFMDRVLA